MVKTEIVNVVATASLGAPIDLGKLTESMEIVYSSVIYRGKVAYFKTSGMTGKVSIFCSGKMISVGTKSEQQARDELEQAKQFLVDRGFIKSVEIQPKTQNIVVTSDLGKSLDLEKFSQNTTAIYEPEQFPGAILRIEKPFKTSVLVFASGKTVITGLKESAQIEPIVKLLEKMIDENQ